MGGGLPVAGGGADGHLVLRVAHAQEGLPVLIVLLTGVAGHLQHHLLGGRVRDTEGLVVGVGSVGARDQDLGVGALHDLQREGARVGVAGNHRRHRVGGRGRRRSRRAGHRTVVVHRQTGGQRRLHRASKEVREHRNDLHLLESSVEGVGGGRELDGGGHVQVAHHELHLIQVDVRVGDGARQGQAVALIQITSEDGAERRVGGGGVGCRCRRDDVVPGRGGGHALQREGLGSRAGSCGRPDADGVEEGVRAIQRERQRRGQV